MTTVKALQMLPKMRFGLRGMFIATTLVSLHLAALGVLARAGSADRRERITWAAACMTIGIFTGLVAGRRSSTFQAGLPAFRLTIPRLRPKWLWQSAAVPVVMLVVASIFESDIGGFPFALEFMALVTVGSGIGLVHALIFRTLSICENGIEVESKFIPWGKFERQGWRIDGHDELVLGGGRGEYRAAVPPDRRSDVEEFLQQKLGEPRGG